jgi:formate hydrogenlyase subunit 3/multisubunit Na+/H+ antiporter MnhD subunit
MSAPLIWIFTPAIFALGLFALNRYKRLSLDLGIIVLLGLAGLAYSLPIGETLTVGPISMRLSDTFILLGRRFILPATDRYVLVMIYLIAAFWFIGALAAHVNSLFAPLALAMVALLVAALAVEPFLYAALMIEMAVLVSIPMLAPPGDLVRQGILRYLIFQTMAMPFILFTGWMLTGLEAGNTDIALTLRVVVLLGLGFAFLLAIFPFYSWIPLLAEQNHPYVAGFVLMILSTVVLLFGVDFIDQYSWLRDYPQLFDILRFAGVMMIVTGGVLAAFQRHLGRIFGYAAIMETGASLLALGLGPKSGLPVFSMLFLPKILGLGVLAVGLSILRERAGSLKFSSISGCGRRDPVLAGSIIFASLSVVGLPLLAGFPPRLALWESLALESTLEVVWSILGMVGLLVGVLRTTNEFFSGEGWPVDRHLPWARYSLMLLGCLVILLVGIQPQWFFPAMLNITRAYPNLLP